MMHNKGFTLIEILIAMVLGLFVVGVTLTVYTVTVRQSSETVKSARLNHDIELAMHVMVNDLRRAGYWGGAIADSNAQDNPFMAATTRLQIPTDSCIVYSYDADGDGNIDDGTNDGINEGVDDTGDENEYYGFKQDGNTIRMLGSGSTTANCDNANWAVSELIDGDEISVTDLLFEFENACLNVTQAGASYAIPLGPTCDGLTVASGDDVVERRVITITMEAELVDDDQVKKRLTDKVTVRNDYIFEVP